jgi:hypothetical protein
MNARSGAIRASRILPWTLLMYFAASLLHFAHNAEFIAQYPNLPTSWSRSDVYLAWCFLTMVGIAGYISYARSRSLAGLTLLATYAALGFGGLLHYTRAPLLRHSLMMNMTIWAEATTASLL